MRAEASLSATTSSWQQAGNVPIEGILRLLRFGYPYRLRGRNTIHRGLRAALCEIHIEVTMPSLFPALNHLPPQPIGFRLSFCVMPVGWMVVSRRIRLTLSET